MKKMRNILLWLAAALIILNLSGCTASQSNILKEINQVKFDIQKIEKSQEKTNLLLETEMKKKEQANNAQIETIKNSLLDIKEKIESTENEIKALTGRIEELQYGMAQKSILSSSPSFTGKIKAKTIPPPQVAMLPGAADQKTSDSVEQIPAQTPAPAGQAMHPQTITELSAPQNDAPPTTPVTSTKLLPSKEETQFTINTARNSFSIGKYDKAVNVLSDFTKKYEEFPERADFLYLLGESYFYNNQPEDAKKTFGLVYEKHRISPRAPDALAFLGQIANKEGNNDKVIEYYDKILSEYPSYTQAERIRQELKLIKPGKE